MPLTDPSPAARRATAAAAALLAAGLLVPIQLKVSRPMLLAERFVPGAGWAEIGLLVLYAAAVAWWMAAPGAQPRVRRWIWRLFSLVFFAQLLIGLAGFEHFLMSGKLHLPVPAMIVAGPLFRGHPSFMVFLLLGTLLAVGPAWCSHLCYLGAWDDALAGRRRRPLPLPRWRRPLQLAVLGIVAAVAWGLHRAGAPVTLATGLGITFGLIGIGVMVTGSRRTGAMVHCLSWCPIGWLATTVGRVSPFRIRLGDGCDGCAACTPACRYDALNPADLARRRPASSCTLCGDCVGRCRGRHIGYWLPGLGQDAARGVFIALAVALHAATLGVARI
jgi:NAD-dependent dihydropyrimidine dehydrogenase PreA subunit